MERPALVILAAGIGSRYGGLKQIDPVGANGELIIDYSIYDALAAGFRKVVFIIKHAIEEDFRRGVGRRMENNIEVLYAYQELDQLPPGYRVPVGRVRPWGTTHALLAARDILGGPFAVINADDYYGPMAFKMLFDWLSVPRKDDGKLHFAMAGYRIENTVSAYGSVARGVCETNSRGFLTGIAERGMVEKTPRGARFSEDGGKSWADIPAGTLVSMNFWGLDEGFFPDAERDFSAFLDANLPGNPLGCECILSLEIGALLRTGRADVAVLKSSDLWCGVTYKEDKASVQRAIAAKHRRGLYPAPLWK